MPARRVLHAAATLVEFLVGVLHEMERIGDLGDVLESVVGGCPNLCVRAARLEVGGACLRKDWPPW